MQTGLAGEARTAGRPVSSYTKLTAPFWLAANEERLTAQRCGACGAFGSIPRRTCVRCGSATLAWEDVSGRGWIYSFTVIREQRHPFFASRTPYVYAMIELEEGVRLTSNVIDCEVDAVAIGMPVVCRFEEVDGGRKVPVFAPGGQDVRDDGGR